VEDWGLNTNRGKVDYGRMIVHRGHVLSWELVNSEPVILITVVRTMHDRTVRIRGPVQILPEVPGGWMYCIFLCSALLLLDRDNGGESG
jgi:hypothetical protein